ncbi:bifunctional NAD(P)HX epimerase / NAD(P)HX dehydratase [Synechococcus sp. A15-62]|nr:bifunctional NAD(P)HX epimerase / NAD(P)HX dehydratase [Synechococcus sp. A15-62]
MLVDAASMGAAEQRLFESGMPVAALMEKVGLAMAAWLLARRDLLRHGVVVLVGPGHNGGDGLVVARELHLAGIEVSLWCPLPIRKTLTAEHLRHGEWLGLRQRIQEPDPGGSELWLDAVFGLGQSRPLPELLADLFRRRQQLRPGALISLDVPSGLCSDQGTVLGEQAACASVTLSVGWLKRGLSLDPARSWVGALVRIDLGLPSAVLGNAAAVLPRRLPVSESCSAPLPPLPPTAMKYERGRCLVVAGSDRYPGAAHLALRGAMASGCGCGCVQAVVPPRLQSSLWQVLPEAMQLEDGVIPERLDAVLVGPGLGESTHWWSQWSEQMLSVAGLLVLDADGLNGLAASPQGWRWLLKRRGPTCLTPHAAEFSQLFPDCDAGDALEKAIAAARCSRCCILLKGAHSVLADPSGAAVVLAGTSPRVARTGLGDLLAGFVIGWGAQGVAAQQQPGLESFAAAAALHGLAAARARSSDASTIADCLKINTARCQKKQTTMFNEV